VTVQPKTQESHQVILRWCEALNQKSNGAVEAVLSGPEAAPGGERDALEGVRALGVFEGCHITTGLLSTVEPKYGLTDLPFIFRDGAHAASVVDGEIGMMLNEALVATAGLRPMMRTYSAFRHVHLANKAIKTVDDFKGVKIRSIQSEIPIRMFQLLGANPVPMAAPEVYTAIQTGVIDGWETPLDAAIGWKTYEVTKQVSLTGHQYVDVVLCFNENFYKGLPKEVQDLMSEISAELLPDHRARMNKVMTDAAEALKGFGVTINEIADKKPFQDAVAPIYDEFGGKHGLSAQIAAIRA
jgi:tripartite ATP-independent transporter DctP family solute receptor